MPINYSTTISSTFVKIKYESKKQSISSFSCMFEDPIDQNTISSSYVQRNGERQSVQEEIKIALLTAVLSPPQKKITVAVVMLWWPCYSQILGKTIRGVMAAKEKKVEKKKIKE